MPYSNIISRADVQALIREQVSDIMMGGLVTESAVLSTFRRINVPTNQTRFPVVSALPTAYFVNGDTGLKQTTEVNFANAYINIEELAAIVPIPDAVIADSSFDIMGSVRPLLQQAIGRAFDNAVLFDVNAPASWPDGVVAAAVAAGNDVERGTHNAAAGGIAEDLNDVLAALEDDGYSATGWIGNPTFRRYLRGARDGNGQLLADVNGGVTNVWGLPATYSMPGLWPSGNEVAEFIALQRENFIVGIRQDFTFSVHNEGVITDNTGAIQYNLMQQDMTAIRVVFRVGWAVSNPLNYQEDTEADRYPAAVLLSPGA